MQYPFLPIPVAEPARFRLRKLYHGWCDKYSRHTCHAENQDYVSRANLPRNSTHRVCAGCESFANLLQIPMNLAACAGWTIGLGSSKLQERRGSSLRYFFSSMSIHHPRLPQETLDHIPDLLQNDIYEGFPLMAGPSPFRILHSHLVCSSRY